MDTKKIQERFYHYQDFDNFEFKDTKFTVSSLEIGDHNGITGQYNFRFEKDLRFGYCLAYRILYAHTTCIEKLKLPWDYTIDRDNQSRYLQNKGCIIGTFSKD